MKTVTHKGKIYQLNSIYVLDDGSKVVLDGVINDESLKVSRLDCEKDWFVVSELFLCDGVVMGTIEDAPIEPKNKEAWYCEFGRAELGRAVLFYNDERWWWDDGHTDERYESGTKPLYKMVKAS